REYYQDLFTVRAASREPSNAYVGVFYRGYYYYIPDDDVFTKEVLTYVSALYDLQSADIQSVQPLLTIPVNR
ncbi:MAG: hypothetical protein JRJ51_23330, partial [Deltaproteobacteria bacterium]|nr:hypothetical protein [Deltaproteobacteria bacterium]